MRSVRFWLGAILVIVAGFAMTRLVANQYYYFAGYVVLQYGIRPIETPGS